MVRLLKIAGDTWFNLPAGKNALSPEDIKGKVVLIDFWTYSCVNCQRTIPHLRTWWQKYKDKNFIMIGIHTPEFEFEKDPKNVAKAINDLGVEWPVVLDNDYVNWNNFSNHYWPAKYLADAEGKIVYSHFGEGAYSETERRIQELIRGATGNIELPKIEDGEGKGGVCFISTPELYCGYLRGAIGNPGGYHYDAVATYRAPKKIREDSITLDGKFIARPEYVESAESRAILFLRFRATEVNLVMGPANGESVVEISLNGDQPPLNTRGRDVNDQSEVIVKKSTMYNLLKSANIVEGVVGIKSKKDNFRSYAFTFSGCGS